MLLQLMGELYTSTELKAIPYMNMCVCLSVFRLMALNAFYSGNTDCVCMYVWLYGCMVVCMYVFS